MLRSAKAMDETTRSKKLIVIALAALVAVPAVSLLVVILGDRSQEALALKSESGSPLAAAAQARALQGAGKSARMKLPVAAVPTKPAGKLNADLVAKLQESRRIENVDPKRSRELLEQVLAAVPDNEYALERLAEKMLIDEQLDRARELADRCSKVNAKNAACKRVSEAAITPKSAPQLKAMADMADECLKKEPERIDCLYGKAGWLLVQRRFKEIEPIAQKLVLKQPDSGFTYVLLGRVKGANLAYGDAHKLFVASCEKGDAQGCFRADVLRSEGW